MSKFLKPKVLAIICIISSIISILTEFIEQATYLFMGFNEYALLFGSLLFRLCICGTIYTVVYLFIILSKKTKNMNTLNLLLLINYILAFLYYVCEFFVSGIAIPKISIFLSVILSLLFIIIVSGIYAKKERQYKTLTIATIGVSFVSLIVKTIRTIDLLFNEVRMMNKTFNILYLLTDFIGTTSQIVGICSFVLFLYLYGKNIIERKEK